MDQRRPAAGRTSSALGLITRFGDGGAWAPPYYNAEADDTVENQAAALVELLDELLLVLLLDGVLLDEPLLLLDEVEAAGAEPEPPPRESVR
ncbi:hypothetical protein CS0771_17830 [Catellatospora sp. IY07-71]|nr:hypothetical protein CS0771_17830 [Catellatospora sp. IY07-71]